MQTIGHFFRLLRWPNLVFIIATQILFHFCVVVPSAQSIHYSFPVQLQQHLFWLLVLASVFIAGAGYIINDYFDVNIDQINKPDKVIISRKISQRMAIFWHGLLSLSGILLSAWVSYALRNPLIVTGNIVCVALLWVYSTTYKRKLIIGNVLISLMTAWVLLVLLVAELPGWWTGQLNEAIEKNTAARLSRIGLLYAAFAFILSLIREVIKDLEDLEGDRREHCKTMPIVLGINASKVFAGNWLAILILMLVVTQIYVLQFGWWWFAAYLLVAVLVPLFVSFKSLFFARTKMHFTQLSSRLKWIMLTGLLSMVFFLWYTQ